MFVFLDPRQPARASRTAEFMALFRALESCRRPRGERLFEDPLAVAFLRPPLRLAVLLAQVPLLGRIVPWFIDSRWPGARSSGVARTRLIDDLLVAALGEGVDQVVLLGAGFDCRAHRLPGIERTRVFEIDRPATLRAKQARLRRRLPRLPDHVVFVEADLEDQDLESALRVAGFSPIARSFFVWEGVTNYLTADAVDATLRRVAAVATPGSRLLFTYVHGGLLDGSITFPGGRRLSRTLRRIGEPWTFGLDPAEVSGFLAQRGFRLLEDWGAADYRARYLGRGADRLRGYEFYRAALAEACPGRLGRAPLDARPASRESTGGRACRR
jgi:methyltransferase (TIGR00027 family)